MQPDLVIRNGTVIDGTGASPVRADVAVHDGRVCEVGDVETNGLTDIDASGLTVAPGFIDIHSHSDYTLLVDPRAVSAIHQGVTLEVIGNCGYGCFPIGDDRLARKNIYGFNGQVPLSWSSAADYMDRLRAAGPAVNVLTLVPNGQLRLSTLGLQQRPATPAELARMVASLEQALEAGAWGFSTGLEYAAEAAAGETELTELCRATARVGGFYATHTRFRDAGSVEAVAEAIRTAENAEIRLQVSHLLPRSGRDDCNRCIDLVDAAKARGTDIAFDMHTRLFGLTYLNAMLPPREGANGDDDLRNYLRDPEARKEITAYRSILSAGNDWDRVVLLDNEVCPEYARMSIARIADDRRESPVDAACHILLQAVGSPEQPMVIIHCYDEDQQEAVFKHGLCVPASDATALALDGPLAGSAFHGAYTWAAWFYRFMVRQTGALSPEQAVHKLTGQPAGTLGLVDRGLLRPGMRADIVVFDGETFGEKGTTFVPNQLAIGMVHVVVNGALTLRAGAPTGQRRGEVLCRQEARGM
jgi:N-acyl-D-aspartate/D-glutamate deacylase